MILDRVSIPCCHECWAPLQFDELKEVLGDRLKLSKKDF